MIAMDEMMTVHPHEMASLLLLAEILGASSRTRCFMEIVFVDNGIGVLPMVHYFVTNLHRCITQAPRALLWLPIARVHMMDRNYLENNGFIRYWYTVNCYIDLFEAYLNMPTTPVPMPPCTWCGLPTGNWCDGCEEQGELPARAICIECETRRMECRYCLDY